MLVTTHALNQTNGLSPAIPPMDTSKDGGTKRKDTNFDTAYPVAKKPRISLPIASSVESKRELNFDKLPELLSDYCSKEKIGQISVAAKEVFAKQTPFERLAPNDIDFFHSGDSVRLYLQNCPCKIEKSCDCDLGEQPAGVYKRYTPAIRIAFDTSAPPKREEVAKLVYKVILEGESDSNAARRVPQIKNMMRVEVENHGLFKRAGVIADSRISECLDANVNKGVLYVKHCNAGTLEHFKDKYKYADHQSLYHQVFVDIIEGLSAFESRGVVNCDFAERNMMLHQEGEKTRAVLIDMQHLQKIGSHIDTVHTSHLVPPEFLFDVLKISPYFLNGKLNVWQAAMIIYEIIFSTKDSRLIFPTGEFVSYFGCLALIWHEMIKDLDSLGRYKGVKPGLNWGQSYSLSGKIKKIHEKISSISSSHFLASWGKERDRKLIELCDDLRNLYNELQQLHQDHSLAVLEPNIKELLIVLLKKLEEAWLVLSQQEPSDPIQRVLCKYMIHPDPAKRKSATELLPLLREAIKGYEVKESGAGSGAG